MSVQGLLSRLDKVRRTGEGQWVACCPAHQDRSPSMTIRELPDGRVLVHDFAGCEVSDILAAVGLTFDALFPEKSPDFAKGERVPFNPRDVLKALAHESMIMALASSSIQQGKKLEKVDHDRIVLAAGRINTAASMCHV